MFNLRELALINEALLYLRQAAKFATEATHATKEEAAEARDKLDDIDAILQKTF